MSCPSPPTPTTSPQQASDLISQLAALKASENLESDSTARNTALALSKKLPAALEGPLNQATELVFKPFITVTARIAVDLNIFSLIVEEGTRDRLVSSAKLAEKNGGEEVLISRILRVVASIDFVLEAGDNLWSANETTTAMASELIAAGHRFDLLVVSAVSSLKYLRETPHQIPTSPTDGFVQYAHQTKLPFFSYLTTRPSLFRDFNLFMGSTMGSHEYSWEWWDVKGRLLEGGDVLFVDVAGGRGHDLQGFVEKLKGMSKAVLDGIGEELDGRVRRMEHDFFKRQPVVGTQVYFLHHIPHDWSDVYRHKILTHLREAMTPGYSRLLIHDLVLPDMGATELQTRFDFTMMTLNGGMERSRSQ
ncbi:putative O-methyltransferase [Clohesyomyces aquaticus]|uniref:Putative O-methyltransferase n=1 Tax=Clohesyomyces aquaticus TaxID=1231657 RepID=A0A1Y1XYD0_9PLEO|nr:putative O-methyltransferase [Clohesyomyces aquaticus]